MDIDSIAHILVCAKRNNSEPIRSLRFSYNNLIRDTGGAMFAQSLSSNVYEIGLVDCGMGDKAGTEILRRMKEASNLRMICIEQNNFSDNLKLKLNIFRDQNPNIMAVY